MPKSLAQSINGFKNIHPRSHRKFCYFSLPVILTLCLVMRSHCLTTDLIAWFQMWNFYKFKEKQQTGMSFFVSRVSAKRSFKVSLRIVYFQCFIHLYIPLIPLVIDWYYLKTFTFNQLFTWCRAVARGKRGRGKFQNLCPTPIPTSEIQKLSFKISGVNYA